MKNLLKTFIFKLNYKIEIKEVKSKFFENQEFYLEAKEMTHGVSCNAYTFIKKGQIKINKEKLKKTKLPSNKLLQKLKQGKNITHQGKKYLAKNLTSKENDVKISFVYDTLFNKKISTFVKNSELLICDSSFHSDIEKKAKENKHLTAKQAGEIAKKSKSKKLVLTHVSQRYDKNLKEILDDAKKVFKNTILVNDFDVVKFK
tara:strand:- start:242 stop:847 length:606 start_codon:yes stop_codon:yes gene_type:complete